ncbi:MAG: methyltransferase domain-containing protein [Verrucomicrobiota bacterium]
MLDRARAEYPVGEWVLGDLMDWGGAEKEAFDLVFSNAAIQWVSDQEALLARLTGCVSEGGAFAFQMPTNRFALLRRFMDDVAANAEWRDRMGAARGALRIEEPEFYCDLLVRNGLGTVDLWVTRYEHVMEDASAIVEWVSSTGLRPFLEALKGDMRERVRDFGRRLPSGLHRAMRCGETGVFYFHSSGCLSSRVTRTQLINSARPRRRKEKGLRLRLRRV